MCQYLVQLGQQNMTWTMNLAAELHQPTLPLAYAKLLLQIAAEKGFEEHAVLHRASLAPDLIKQSQGYITPWEYVLLHISAAQLTGDQGIGMELGVRMRPTAHGFLGYALLSCTDLRQALQLSLRFMRIRQQQIGVEYFSEGDFGIVKLKEKHDFGPVRHFFIEGMLIGCARSAQYLVGDDQLAFELWLDYPEPDYFERFRSQLPQLRFNMPDIRVMFTAQDLDRPLRMSDPIASEQAIRQCEAELASLTNSKALLDEVQQIIREAQQSPPPLEHVAQELCMSSRSLKRKLANFDTSYQQLVNDFRFSLAQQYLSAPRPNIEQIAHQLGYAEPASFTRAFKKWSGSTPSNWTKQSNPLQ